MNLSLLSRYAFFAFCVLFTLGSLPFLDHEWLWPFTLLGAVLSLIGIAYLARGERAKLNTSIGLGSELDQ